MNECDAYLMLKEIANLSSISIKKLEEEIGDISLIFDLSDREIYSLQKINLNIKKNIVKYRMQVYLDELKNLLYKKSVKYIYNKDIFYPEKLRHIYNEPLVLFYRGCIENLTNRMNIAVVGSRKPSYYGIDTAKTICQKLSDLGIGIVSGLAIGIDANSHIGCMNGKSPTIAVLGSSPDNVLPKQNIALADKILAKGGLILSEYCVGSGVIPSNFCMRNRIISGISEGVVVVEAAKKSGALITADFALEQGRNVFAVPGNINSSLSKGCHKIIKEGAKLIENIEDILEEYNFSYQIEFNEEKSKKQEYELDEHSKKVVKCIEERGSVYIDHILDCTGFDLKTTSSILNKLVLEEIIMECKSKTYRLL